MSSCKLSSLSHPVIRTYMQWQAAKLASMHQRPEPAAVTSPCPAGPSSAPAAQPLAPEPSASALNRPRPISRRAGVWAQHRNQSAQQQQQQQQQPSGPSMSELRLKLSRPTGSAVAVASSSQELVTPETAGGTRAGRVNAARPVLWYSRTCRHASKGCRGPLCLVTAPSGSVLPKASPHIMLTSVTGCLD